MRLQGFDDKGGPIIHHGIPEHTFVHFLEKPRNFLPAKPENWYVSTPILNLPHQFPNIVHMGFWLKPPYLQR